MKLIKNILKEKHKIGCDCSYCKDIIAHSYFSFGFWTPINKSFNSWWLFFFVGKKNNHYI